MLYGGAYVPTHIGVPIKILSYFSISLLIGISSNLSLNNTLVPPQRIF